MNRYAAYHAEDWAEGRTDDEIRQEIARVKQKVTHTYQWNEVGCAYWDYTRERMLQVILNLRAAGTYEKFCYEQYC
jgi:hypothetical protein